jgi:hypothetical protein
MTPARGWIFLIVLSVVLIGQGVICAMRVHVILRELRACQHELPPRPAIENHPRATGKGQEPRGKSQGKSQEARGKSQAQAKGCGL